MNLWLNTALEPTAVGACRSAVAVHVASQRWLGIIRAMRFLAISFALAVGILCQGCVVFHYPTPEVRGSVIDATTKQPVAGVRVQDWKHSHIFCETSADGAFDLPAGHFWGPCFLMPGDYLIIAPLTFKSSGYQTVTNDYLGSHDGSPVILKQAIELSRP